MDTYWKLLWEEPCAENEDLAAVIAGRIRKLFDENILVCGERLPPLRTVSKECKIPERIVRKVYHTLEKEGLVEIRQSYGVFARLKGGKITAYWPGSEVIKLNDDLDEPMPGTFKVSTISAGFDYPNPKSFSMVSFTNFLQGAYTDYMAASDTAIQKVMSTELSRYLKFAHVLASPEQCTYIPYRVALPIICSVVFKPGDIIVLDSPEDLEARMVFTRAGLRVLFTGSDHYGMITSKLEEYCREYPVKGVFVRPPAGYPSNIHLSPKRRLELVRVAHQYNLVIIGNDSDHELWRSKVMVPVAGYEHRGRLIYYSSLSKVCNVLSSHAVVAATPDIIRIIEEKVRLSVSHEELCTALAVCRIVNDGRFRETALKVKKEFQKRLMDVLKLSRQSFEQTAEVSAAAVAHNLWICFKYPLPADAVMDLLQQFGIGVAEIYNSRGVSVQGLTGLRLGVTYIENERLVRLFEAFCTLLN